MRNLKILLGLVIIAFLVILEFQWCRADAAGLIINEIMINPAAVADNEGEWIELYNYSSQAVDLEGWKIKSQSSEHVIEEEALIDPKDVVVLCRNGNPEENGGIICDYQYSSLNFVNAGGELGLESPQGSALSLNYSQNMVIEGKSLEFTKLEALDSGTLSLEGYALEENWKPSISELDSGDFGTPREANSTLVSQEEEENFTVLITEIFPNPDGVDGPDNEFIEIFNPNEFAVNLKGWEIINKKGQGFVFEDNWILEPESYAVVYRNVFGFSLYNQEGKVTLFSKGELETDSIGFSGSAAAGESLNKDLAGNIFWSTTISPGEAGVKTEKEEEEELLEEDLTWQEIKNLEEIDSLENKALVLIKGLMLSPLGVPKKDFFYLEKEGRGILIKAKFDLEIQPEDILLVKGELRKLESYNYILLEDKDNLEKTGKGKISYNKLPACPEKESLEKIMGAAVEFKGVFEKKNSNYLYFEDEGGCEMRVYLLKSLALGSLNFEKGAVYRVRGVLEENSSGLRVVATGKKFFKVIKEKPEKEKEEVLKKSSKNSRIKGGLGQKERVLGGTPAGLIKDGDLIRGKVMVGKNFFQKGRAEEFSWSWGGKGQSLAIKLLKALSFPDFN